MKLSKIVLDKIKELGLKGSADFFSRSTSAIKTWQNKPDSIPAWAVEKAMEGGAPITATEIKVPSHLLPEEPDLIADILNRLQDLHNRVAKIESTRLESSAMPPQPTNVMGQQVAAPATVRARPNWTEGHPSIAVLPRV